MGSRNDIREGCFGKRDQKWGPEMTSGRDVLEGESKNGTQNQKKSVSSSGFGFFLFSCLLAARARSRTKRTQNQKKIHNRFTR